MINHDLLGQSINILLAARDTVRELRLGNATRF